MLLLHLFLPICTPEPILHSPQVRDLCMGELEIDMRLLARLPLQQSFITLDVAELQMKESARVFRGMLTFLG